MERGERAIFHYFNIDCEKHGRVATAVPLNDVYELVEIHGATKDCTSEINVTIAKPKPPIQNVVVSDDGNS